jgi:hypothetical protein
MEEIRAELHRVLDTLTEKDLQEAFQKWRRRWDRCVYEGGTTSRMMAADGFYVEFYECYSVRPEYFGYTLVRYYT